MSGTIPDLLCAVFFACHGCIIHASIAVHGGRRTSLSCHIYIYIPISVECI